MKTSDLAALGVLDALLQETSVSRAAEKTGLSTPAVSHALNRLRARFDDPLLVRAGRSMVLTPRAEALRPLVHDAMAAAALVFAPVEPEDLTAIQRRLTLAMSDYVTMLIGARFDEGLRTHAPNLDLRIVLNTPDDPERLRLGDVDMVVGIYARLPPEVKRRKVVVDRLVCVLRREHPAVNKRLTLRQYLAAEHLQVAPRGRPGGIVDATLAARGEQRRVARAVPFFRFALELVAETDYLLTVPERLAHRFADRFDLRVLELPFEMKPYALSLVWHPRYDGDRPHRFLREHIAGCFAALDGPERP